MADLPRTLPGSLAAFPRLDDWLAFSPDGAVTLFPGKVELGQGLLTALAQIAADELDIPIGAIRFAPTTTGASPNEGVTSGSQSIRDCGMAIRQAAAEARALFLDEAARRLGAAIDDLTVRDGVIRGDGNRSISYGELAGSVSLARAAIGQAKAKAASTRRIVGAAAQRIDIPGRVFGDRPFIHDVVLPNMMHGRVLRPPRPGAELLDVDPDAAIDAIVVRDGSFLGVVASTERAAEKAATRLAQSARWRGGFSLPPMAELGAWLQSQPADSELVAARGDLQGEASLTRSFFKPFLAHVSIAPSCAIARWADGGLRVWSHSQGVYNLRADLALALAIEPEAITVEHAEGAGCYGHNGADDVALDAALLARAAPGRPVRVQWSRSDELTWSPLGAAMLVRCAATLSPQGRIAGWRHEIWSNGHTARPGRLATPVLLAGYDLAQPFPRLPAVDPPLASGGGAQRNAVPLYDIPDLAVTKHRVLSQPIRTSAMRSLGAIGNIFAIESMMDDLAAMAGDEPLTFRLKHLSDPRARAVLERAAAMAERSPLPAVRGRGIAFARYKNTSGYCAVVAEIDVETEPRATRLWIAADVGEAINPDGAINQIEGGAIQSVSWALKEEARFSREALECGSWESYPILRFSEVPDVEVELIVRPEEPPLGAGEISQGPVTAALANAIHAALGVRLTRMPFTRDSIIAAMEQDDA